MPAYYLRFLIRNSGSSLASYFAARASLPSSTATGLSASAFLSIRSRSVARFSPTVHRQAILDMNLSRINVIVRPSRSLIGSSYILIEHIDTLNLRLYAFRNSTTLMTSRMQQLTFVRTRLDLFFDFRMIALGRSLGGLSLSTRFALG